MNTPLTHVMLNAGAWFGFGGGVAALATISHPGTKLITSAALFALAAGSALRNYCFAAPVSTAVEPGDYPYDTPTAPWARDGSPAGL